MGPCTPASMVSFLVTLTSNRNLRHVTIQEKFLLFPLKFSFRILLILARRNSIKSLMAETLESSLTPHPQPPMVYHFGFPCSTNCVIGLNSYLLSFLPQSSRLSFLNIVSRKNLWNINQYVSAHLSTMESSSPHLMLIKSQTLTLVPKCYPISKHRLTFVALFVPLNTHWPSCFLKW